MRFNLAPRAAVLLAIGLDITFKQGRGITWAIGMLFWMGLGLVIANLAPLAVSKFRKDYLANVKLWVPEILLAAGLAYGSFANPFGNEGGGYGYFMSLVAVWGFGSFVVFAFNFLVQSKGSQDRKDSVTSGALGLALGILYVTAPLGAIPAVGFLGAYLVIMGVHLGISAATARKG